MFSMHFRWVRKIICQFLMFFHLIYTPFWGGAKLHTLSSLLILFKLMLWLFAHILWPSGYFLRKIDHHCRLQTPSRQTRYWAWELVMGSVSTFVGSWDDICIGIGRNGGFPNWTLHHKLVWLQDWLPGHLVSDFRFRVTHVGYCSVQGHLHVLA